MLVYERIHMSYGNRVLPTVTSNPRESLAETQKLNRVSGSIVNAALKVHRQLGPGLLENVYEACLEYELTNAGLQVQRQVAIPLNYGTLRFKEAYRLDLLVENNVIVELKTSEKLQPVHKAQVLTYLRLTRKRLALVITFNTTLLKNGILRLIL